MLKITIPNICQKEQYYALDVMLGEFLGLSFQVKEANEPTIKITKSGSSASLTLSADFFHQAHKDWLKPKSMPNLSLRTWTPIEDGIEAKLVKEDIPIIYGRPGLIKNDQNWASFI